MILIGRAEPDAANPKQSWYDELVRAPDFLAAARKLRVDVTVASEEPSTLEGIVPLLSMVI